MEVKSISELYSKLSKDISTIYVVPLIRFNFKETDYLYLLYKELIENDPEAEIRSTSVFSHFRFVFHQLMESNIVLHYHWLEFQDFKSLIGMPYKILCIALYSLFGGRIVWTVHNLIPHTKKFISLNKSLQKWLAKKANYIHVHSGSAIALVSRYYEIPESKFVVLAHPTFPKTQIEPEIAKQYLVHNFKLDRSLLSKPTLLMIGNISSYKGFDEAINILSSKDLEYTLIIAGKAKKNENTLHHKLEGIAKENERIVYIPEFISELDYPNFQNATDICLFNYDEILTSGGVEMARSYNKTIIAPAKGTLIDLREQDNVHLFESKDELASLLEREITNIVNE